MTKQQQVLNLLGLAQRAGKIISGEELVIKSIQSGRAEWILLAEDAGPNLTKKIKNKAQYYHVALSTAFTALEISSAIGRPRKVIAVTDAGFAKKMRFIMD